MYNEEKYKADQIKIKDLTEKKKVLSKNLEKRCSLLFGELYISAMHLKVIRVYIDAVLRFSIPINFNQFVIQTSGLGDKKILELMTKEFADPTQLEMFGSKEEIQDSEDFYPFVIAYMNV